MRRLLAATLALTLAVPAAWGDVIPSQYADKEASGAREAVSQRLQEFGVSGEQACAHAESLLDAEAKYFAARPDRIQLAGQEQEEEDDDEPSYDSKVWYGATYLTVTVAAIAAAIIYRN